jgi:serine/threonine-protein kinase
LAARENDYQAGDTIRGNGAEYLVTGVLGSGGMGAVYAVKDKNIGRRFVLKILHGWLAHRHDLKERFEHEARALGHLSHPGIIEIFQLNRTRDDKQMPYYLMEPLSGESLADSLRRRKKLDLFPALGIATKLLYALEHAHERGIIHRDIKPDNVFLHQGASSEPVVKLLDFGILKLVESEEDPGVFIGTPRFAAPEQLRTDRVIGPKADLYSVGVVLFQMVTGHLPFEGYGGSLEEMVHTLVVDAPPITKHGDYPPELVTLVASALAKDPEHRPADAFAFASALRGIRQACAPDREDPHTHATAEVIARAARGQRDPSQITSAHLAAPTAPDEDIEKLMDALRAGAQTRLADVAAPDASRDGLERAVTGFESTAEEAVAKAPSPTEAARARAKESDARRAAVTALPRSPAEGHDSGSVRYVTREAPIERAQRAAQVQHTAPLIPGKASRQHFTEPMAGRPARPSAPPAPEDARTPEPQEIERRPSTRARERQRTGARRAILGAIERVVPIRFLPWALGAGTVALMVGILALRTRGVDLTKTTGAATPAVVPAASAAPVTTATSTATVATTAPPVAPLPLAAAPPFVTVTRPAAPAAASVSASASPTARVAPIIGPKKKPLSPADVGFE